MAQPIAGVPSIPSGAATGKETTVMAVYPSISARPIGQTLGRWFQIDAGVRPFGVPLTIGGLLALKTIPITLALYFDKIVPRLPFVLFGSRNPRCRRYRLTSQRVLIDYPFEPHVFASIGLDQFDSIDIEVQPGQEWYKAGDLVFRQAGKEKLRLAGVPRPETFRQTCLKARASYAGVRDALGRR